MTQKYLLAAIALAWASASTAHAQESASQSDWSVTVSPYVFGKSLRGKVDGLGQSTPVDVPLSEAFKTLNGIFMGEISVDSPRWGAFLDYQGTDSRDELTALGLPVKAELHLNSLAGAIYYVAHEAELGGETVHGKPRVTRIRPLVGARWSKARAQLNVANGVIDQDRHADWTDVIVGVRTDTDVSDRWQFSGHFDVGGFDPGKRFSMNGHATMNYRTHLANRPTTLRVGYEVLFQEYRQTDFLGDRFVWHMTQHGPTAGISITF